MDTLFDRLGEHFNTVRGSAALKIFPDQHSSLIDLFVRESIQNSLDAGCGDSKYIQTEFVQGYFNSKALTNELPAIAETLANRYSKASYRFISVKDSRTEGLTGPLYDSTGLYPGNLFKLVYDILNPQEREGAGGSCGQGKTVYFRLGCGLVFYYSRIYDETTKSFQSRLAGTLAEDSKRNNRIIPHDINSTGFAWFGAMSEDYNTTIPITDVAEINKFLRVFNISPYEEKETGTTIIIPYLKDNNELYRVDNNSLNVTLSEYIKTSIQKWYFSRLNNTLYNGKFLRVYINNEPIKQDDMLPVFKVLQDLYNSTTKQIENTPINLIDININNTFQENRCAGKIATIEVDKSILRMLPPDNCHSPFEYLNLEDGTDSHPIIFTFCRKVGMAISYNDDLSWIQGIPQSDSEHFRLAIFVLNSDNKLSDGTSLDEYVRKCELANHNAWNDQNVQKWDIIKKIKRNTAQKLKQEFSDTDNEKDTTQTRHSPLGSKLAELILPPKGFFIKPQKQTSPKKKTINFTKHKNFSFALTKVVYNETNTITLNYKIKINADSNTFNLCGFINSETGAIDLKDWIEKGLEIPFEISEVTLNSANQNNLLNISRESNSKSNNDFTIRFIRNNNKVHGVECLINNREIKELDVTMVLHVYSKDVQPIIKPQ